MTLSRTQTLVLLSGALLGGTLVRAGAIAAPAPHGATPPAPHAARRDSTCAACTDFYGWANRRWLDTTRLAPDQLAAGTGLDVQAHDDSIVRDLLERAARGEGAPAGSAVRKAGLFYATCMDSARADRDGARPLAPRLARLAATERAGLAAAVADAHLAGATAAFSISVQRNPAGGGALLAMIIPDVGGLPNPTLYVAPDSGVAGLRRAYQAHVARTLQLAGDSAALAEREAAQVVAVETTLARALLADAETRDASASLHPMSVDSLVRLAPGFAWRDYFAALGRPDLQRVNVTSVAYVTALGTLAPTLPIESWRAYLRWRVASAASSALGSALTAERFRFVSALTGTRALPPRTQTCLTRTNTALGGAVGQAFVARAFSPEARRRATELVADLRSVLEQRIRSYPWQSEETRRAALAKFAALRVRIGYPDVWPDYGALRVDTVAFYDNLAAANAFALRHELARADRPENPAEWTIGPQTMEAYFNQFANEITLPAGILQPPFFDPKADRAANYGAAGAIIGHELTHGYDDQGRQFDGAGQLHAWGSPADAQRFDASAARLTAQYARYPALDEPDTLRVNAARSIGENMADLGGMQLAYAAFERSQARHRDAARDGLTPEQRFFVAYAVAFRAKITPTFARLRAASDPHPPARWRVNGVVSNLPEFARAFGCTPADSMARPDSARVLVW